MYNYLIYVLLFTTLIIEQKVAALHFFYDQTTNIYQENINYEQKILEIIDNPQDDKRHLIFFKLDEDNSIIEIIRRYGEQQQIIKYSELKTKEVVIARSNGYDAVLMSCIDCDSQKGGVLTLRYLYNGIFGSYRQFNMRLVPKGNKWHAYTADHKLKIFTLRLVKKIIMGRVVGIQKIVVNR